MQVHVQVKSLLEGSLSHLALSRPLLYNITLPRAKVETKDDNSTSLLVDGDGTTGIAEFQECPIVFKSSSSTVRIHVLRLVFSNLALLVLWLLILDTAYPSHSPCLLLRGIYLVGNVRRVENMEIGIGVELILNLWYVIR